MTCAIAAAVAATAAAMLIWRAYHHNVNAYVCNKRLAGLCPNKEADRHTTICHITW